MWFQRTFIYRLILMRVLPYLGFRLWGNPRFPMTTYRKIREDLREFDKDIWVFLGVNKWACSYLINKALTGAKWSHAGFLYLDNTNEVKCLHMMHQGLCDWDLWEYLREVDDFVWFRVPCYHVIKAKQRIESIKQISPQYDFNFELDGKPTSLYCSELVYMVFNGLTEGFESHPAFGRETFSPDDLFKIAYRNKLI